MAIKEITKLEIEAVVEYPINGPVTATVVVEFIVDSLRELGVQTRTVRVSWLARDTRAQLITKARTAIDTLLQTEGLGGHTVREKS